MRGKVIAIDGPVASGKGTLAPLLAEKLNGFYLQTGATYRCVALYCLEQKIDLKVEENVVSVLPDIIIDFSGEKVFLNDSDVTMQIRQENIAMGSSIVAAMPPVRSAMIRLQRKIAEERLQQGQIVVAEGRDTGTRLFPDADLKLFLTAVPDVRAKRRMEQLAEGGNIIDFPKVLEDLYLRDKQDQGRKTDPLVSEPEKYGYTVLDSSYLNQEDTLEKIMELLKERKII